MNKAPSTWVSRRSSCLDRPDSMIPSARERFGKAWDVSLPAGNSGANLLEILSRIRSGQIKALYVVGENPLATLPASLDVKRTLEKLEFLIVQDPFLTETANWRISFFLPQPMRKKMGPSPIWRGRSYAFVKRSTRWEKVYRTGIS